MLNAWQELCQPEIKLAQDKSRVLISMLASLIDAWRGALPKDIITLDVSFDEISERAFRMFENHKFRLKKKTQLGAEPDAAEPRRNKADQSRPTTQT